MQDWKTKMGDYTAIEKLTVYSQQNPNQMQEGMAPLLNKAS